MRRRGPTRGKKEGRRCDLPYLLKEVTGQKPLVIG